MDIVDQKLISRAKKGDSTAFAELVDRYKDRIFSYVQRMVGNRDDALDLSQETFLRVYSNLGNFSLGQPFKPWLYRIATNLAIDHLRKKRDIISLDAPLGNDSDWHWELPDYAPGPEELRERAELSSALASLVAKLPAAYRSVILLRHGHELSYQEIAEVLHVPVSTVKTRLFRAREALRLKLVEQKELWEAEC